MICVGLKNSIVMAVLDIADESEYQKFAYQFEALIDTTGFSSLPGIGWEWTGASFSYGQLDSVPSVKLTKLAFESRLTTAEEGSIIGFALANFMTYYTTPTHPLFLAACQVFAMLRRQSNATYVDISRADTIQGVGALVSLGLITSARASLILNTPPTHDESYKGQ